MDEHQLRQQLCQATHQLWTRGMAPGDSGSVSVECHRRRYLVTPPGRRRSNLHNEDLLVVDIGGEAVEGHILPANYWRPHRMAYQSNGLSQTSVGPGIHAAIVVRPPMTLALLRRRGTTDRIVLPGTDPLVCVGREDEAAIAEALRETTVIALDAEHVLAVGPDLNIALNTLERLEHAATIELAATR